MIEHNLSQVIIIKVTMLISLKSKRMIEHSYFSRVIIIANKIGLGMTWHSYLHALLASGHMSVDWTSRKQLILRVFMERWLFLLATFLVQVL